MKKTISYCAAIVIVFLLSACTSQSVRTVEKQIQDIGEISIESGDAICTAEQLYNAMTEKEKSEVSNVADLKAARDNYEKCIADAVTQMVSSGNYKEAENLAASLDETTKESLAPNFVQEFSQIIISSLENGDMSRDDFASFIDTVVNITDAENVSEAEEYYPAIRMILTAQKYAAYENDLSEFYDKYNDDMMSIASDIDLAIEKQSLQILQYCLQKVELLSNQIVYTGTDELVLKYIGVISFYQEGLSDMIFGILSDTSEKIDDGIEKILEGIRAQKEVLEIIAENSKNTIELAETMQTTKELYGID